MSIGSRSGVEAPCACAPALPALPARRSVQRLPASLVSVPAPAPASVPAMSGAAASSAAASPDAAASSPASLDAGASLDAAVDALATQLSTTSLADQQWHWARWDNEWWCWRNKDWWHWTDDGWQPSGSSWGTERADRSAPDGESPHKRGRFA